MPSNTTFPTPAGAAAPLGVGSGIPGQTVLAIGIVPGLPSSSYYTPFAIESVASAANLFGAVGAGTDFVRSIAEVARQGAPGITAICVAGENELPSLFDYLTDVPFDVVLPARLVANTSRLNLFSSFAYGREQQGQPIVVVMSALSDTINHLTTTSTGALLGLSSQDATVALARYFVFTLDQLYVNPNLPSQYQADAAPSVVGLMVRNLPSVSITNQTLRGVLPVSLYAATDAKLLANAGYTVLSRSVRHGLVPYLGVTGTSTASSDRNYSPNFHRLQTLRTQQYVVQLLWAAVNKLIGEPAGSSVRGTVSKLMDGLVSQGIILAYDSNVAIAQAAGSITIALDVLPVSETTMLTVSTRVNIPVTS